MLHLNASARIFLIYIRYIPGICLQVDFGIYQVYYQVYTRSGNTWVYTRYIPGIYPVYTPYIADMVIRREYTRYIPGKCHF